MEFRLFYLFAFNENFFKLSLENLEIILKYKWFSFFFNIYSLKNRISVTCDAYNRIDL